MARGDARARWRAEEGDLPAVADHELHGFGLMGWAEGGEGFEGRGPFYERVDLLGGQEARLKVIAVRPSARR